MSQPVTVLMNIIVNDYKENKQREWTVTANFYIQSVLSFNIFNF